MADKPKTLSDKQVRRQIVEKIIEGLEKGYRPWRPSYGTVRGKKGRRSWSGHPNNGLATNVHHRRVYGPTNLWILEIVADMLGYNSKWWGTAAQWESLGGEIMEDEVERPTEIYQRFPIWVDAKDADEDDGGRPRKRKVEPGKKKRIFRARAIDVYNIDQVNGHCLSRFRVPPPDRKTKAPTIDETDFARADAIVEATGAKITVSPRTKVPCYNGRTDRIHMPPVDFFRSQVAFTTVRFHELTHWAERRGGWNKRVEAKETGDQGEMEKVYAEGELIAEMGSCFLANAAGLPVEDWNDHVGYIGHWIERLQQNPNFLFQCHFWANKLSDTVLAYSRPKKRSRKSDEIRRMVMA